MLGLLTCPPVSLGGYRIWSSAVCRCSWLSNPRIIARQISGRWMLLDDTVEAVWMDASDQMKRAKPHGWAHEGKPQGGRQRRRTPPAPTTNGWLIASLSPLCVWWCALCMCCCCNIQRRCSHAARWDRDAGLILQESRPSGESRIRAQLWQSSGVSHVLDHR